MLLSSNDAFYLLMHIYTYLYIHVYLCMSITEGRKGSGDLLTVVMALLFFEKTFCVVDFFRPPPPPSPRCIASPLHILDFPFSLTPFWSELKLLGLLLLSRPPSHGRRQQKGPSTTPTIFPHFPANTLHTAPHPLSTSQTHIASLCPCGNCRAGFTHTHTNQHRRRNKVNQEDSNNEASLRRSLRSDQKKACASLSLFTFGGRVDNQRRTTLERERERQICFPHCRVILSILSSLHAPHTPSPPLPQPPLLPTRPSPAEEKKGNKKQQSQ